MFVSDWGWNQKSSLPLVPNLGAQLASVKAGFQFLPLRTFVLNSSVLSQALLSFSKIISSRASNQFPLFLLRVVKELVGPCRLSLQANCGSVFPEVTEAVVGPCRRSLQVNCGVGAQKES